MINGLIKTGKTYTLLYLLPSVIAQDDDFGVGKDQEPMVLYIECSSLDRWVRLVAFLSLPLFKSSAALT
ncbi:hypothetical protein WJX75_006271 [Coccomyxa subellipsoidea]|uniref:Uncharacterized protein n=1 Tax=Coccomyxa subellipsoidea TaxID=248742 RepID=A0ABR2YTY0_9CHLO